MFEPPGFDHRCGSDSRLALVVINFSLSFATSHVPSRFHAHPPVPIAGAATVTAYSPMPTSHTSTTIFLPGFICAVPIAAPLTPRQTHRPGIMSPFSSSIPFYNIVCSMVGARKCGRIGGKIHSRSIGEGERIEDAIFLWTVIDIFRVFSGSLCDISKAELFVM